jgi:hypothetical protein
MAKQEQFLARAEKAADIVLAGAGVVSHFLISLCALSPIEFMNGFFPAHQ